jgi:hypothetical protein
LHHGLGFILNVVPQSVRHNAFDCCFVFDIPRRHGRQGLLSSVLTFTMRLLPVAGLLFSALFVSAKTTGKDAPTADELIQQLTQLDKCAVCHSEVTAC